MIINISRLDFYKYKLFSYFTQYTCPDLTFYNVKILVSTLHVQSEMRARSLRADCGKV